MQTRIGVAALLVPVLLAGVPFFQRAASAADSGGSAAVAEHPPKEAAAMIREYGSREDFVLLDVRTPLEYGVERLAGAVMIDYYSATFREELGHLDRGKTYLVYCRTGNRSGKTASLMEEMGFRNVHHLSGGIVKWKEDGLPTVR